MSSFKAADFYQIDDLFTEEERMARDAVREWVSAEFMPIIEEHNRAATFPQELVPQLGEMGAPPARASRVMDAPACRRRPTA